MFDLQPWQWGLVMMGALLAGVSKTGITGLGVLTVALYANVLPARQSTGIILPMLVCADVVAVAVYRRHAVWGAFVGIISMGHDGSGGRLSGDGAY